MIAMAELRQRVGMWVGGFRAAPIPFTPEQAGLHYGSGLASNQPDHATLLRENIGVSDIATRAIANRLSTLNPQVKISRKKSDGMKVDEILNDHVLKVLLDKPHEDFTRKQTLRLIGQYIPTVGEAYLLKIRNGLGIPAMLQPMPAKNVSPVLRKSLVASYTVRDGKGNIHTIPKSEVIRIWFPDPETLYESEGYLGPNAIVTDALRFATEHLRSHYQNDATPIGMIKATEEATSDPEEFKRWQREFAQKYHSRGGTHRSAPALLPLGWEWVEMAMKSGADVTPLLEYFQQNQLMNFGVPQSTLGRVVSGDRSTAETNDWVFDKHAVKPIADLVADAFTDQLAPDFDDKIFVEFEQFVAEDKEFELKQEAQDLKLKVRSGQQVIEDRNGDPDRAPWAEFPVGTIAEVPYTGDEMEPDTDDDAAAFGELDDDAEGDEDADRAAKSQYRRSSKARSKHFSPANEWKRVLRRERKFRPRFERELKAVFNAQRKEALKKLGEIMVDEDRMRSAVPAEALFDVKAWSKMFEVKIEPIRKSAYIASGAEAIAGIGVGSFEFTPIVAARLAEYGGDMIVQVQATTLKRLKRALAVGAEEGQSIGTLTKSVNAAFGGRRRNAATIARTELLRATQDAQLEGFDQSGVVEWKQWNDNQDSDVRDSHYGSLIAIVKSAESFILANGARADFPGDANLAPSDSINCFPAGTLVSGDVQLGLEAMYAGSMIQLGTAAGHRLTVTANHPVLTEHGFVPAHSLRKDTNLIRHLGWRASIRGVHEQDSPALIEDVIASLSVRGSVHETPSAFDLHGDAKRTNGDIHIVGADRELWLASRNQLEERPLESTDASESRVVRGSASNLALQRVDIPAPRLPGRDALTPLGLVRHSTPLDPLCFGPAAQLDASRSEVSIDTGSANPAFALDLLNRHAVSVALDPIVDIRKFDFCGHVYDLQTVGGWTLAQGLFVSNCRCFLTPVFDDPEGIN